MTTYDDIYNGFMIEYDKANITSSYPSITKHEAYKLLNKAYLALISQKFTGNNPRKAQFESDIKSIEDLRPLITTEKKNGLLSGGKIGSPDYKVLEVFVTEDGIKNQYYVKSPKDMLYYVQSYLVDRNDNVYNTDLVTHNTSQMFKQTATNTPWIENPVVYMEGNRIYILVDPSLQEPGFAFDVYITFIKTPIKFEDGNSKTEFELSDQMAEELINLAILFATEITESPRLQSKSSTLQLES